MAFVAAFITVGAGRFLVPFTSLFPQAVKKRATGKNKRNVDISLFISFLPQFLFNQ
jgi:hypothetical protein